MPGHVLGGIGLEVVQGGKRGCACVAAGVATAFASPIGGLLFCIEEGVSFYSISIFWRGFLATGVGVLTLHFLVAFAVRCARWAHCRVTVDASRFCAACATACPRLLSASTSAAATVAAAGARLHVTCSWTSSIYLLQEHPALILQSRFGRYRDFGLYTDSLAFYGARMFYYVWDVPVFILMGCIGGLMGAGFCHFNVKITQWRHR
jgi:Voltage gated chloride channel